MNNRTAIMNGKVETPKQIMELVGTDHVDVMDAMFQALWFNFKKNKSGISATYWSDRFGNKKAFNAFLKHLSRAGWITTQVEPTRNWAEVFFRGEKLHKWVSRDEVLNMRQFSKFEHYKLTNEYSESPNMTRTSKGVKDVGISRPGQTKQSSTLFKYDTVMLSKYKEEIVLNVTKGIRNLEIDYDTFADNVDYRAIATSVVEYHMFSADNEFCLGGHKSDSRGRAISEALRKVFNPIGFKDARALLVVEAKPLSFGGYAQVYLAISELLGYKPSTIQEKQDMGEAAYKRRAFHNLDLTTEHDRNELHENIWLERIYNNLDVYDGTNWSVPIELDATASMLQVEGILLNHAPYLEKTNIIGSTLEDVWTVEGIPRKMYKAAATPTLYGSSASAKQLWTANKVDFNAIQVARMNEDLNTGVLAVADRFKNFIIENVKPQEEMKVKVWGEEFTVNCNRYKNVGDYTKRYDVYCSETDTVKSIFHTHTHKEADLDQFRRYFVTLLVHNIDSQIADTIANSIEWCIPIYDAFIVHPADALEVRRTYANELDRLHADRETVVTEYFRSVGIDSKSAKAWTELKNHVVEPKEPFKAQLTALK